MTNTIAETGTRLTADQSKIVRALDEALDALFDADLLPATDDFAARHNEVFLRSLELQREFPELAAQAADMYEDESPEEPEFPFAGPSAALFELLVSLRAFAEAKTFREFVRVGLNLQDEISDVKSFSEDWNWENGVWK